MISGLMSNFLNIILNFFLIYESRDLSLLGMTVHVWGAGFGVAGAAGASALATGIAGVYVLWSLTRKKSVLKVRWTARWDGQVARRVLRVAYPAALERAAINLGQMVFARMVSSVDIATFAAHNQAIQVESMGYMPAYGFSAAATTLVGQSLGAKRPDMAKRFAWITIGTGASMMAFLAVLITYFGVNLFFGGVHAYA
jgi:Na+-driven multidrug efflux pump